MPRPSCRCRAAASRSRRTSDESRETSYRRDRRRARGGLAIAHRRRCATRKRRRRTQRAPSATRIPAQTDGEYLARAGDCIACHTARGGQPFAGGLEMPTPFGSLFTPNITPDPETGIGKWTRGRFLPGAARRQVEGRLAPVSRVSVSELHQGHARRLRRDLRLHHVDRAGEAEEHAAQAASSRTTSATCWSAGARSTSSRASTSPTPSSRRSGTAARTSCWVSAIATPATRAAISSVRP